MMRQDLVGVITWQTYIYQEWRKNCQLMPLQTAIITTLTGCCQAGRGIPEVAQLPKARQMHLELVINHISCHKLLLSVLTIIKIN